jgi:hypothetical protein
MADQRLMAKILASKAAFMDDVKDLKHDVERILRVFDEFRKEVYTFVQRITNHIPGQGFFHDLHKEVKMLETAMSRLSADDGASQHAVVGSMVCIRNLFLKLFKHGHEVSEKVFVVKGDRSFRNDIEACDPLLVLDVLRDHFRSNNFVVKFDFTEKMEYLISNSIPEKTEREFPRHYDNHYQFFITPLPANSEMRVDGLDFFPLMSFRLLYMRFIIFDCHGGFVLNLPNHTFLTAPADKTIFIEKGFSHRVRSISDECLKKILLTDFSSVHFWNVAPYRLKRKKSAKVAQSDIAPMPHISARQNGVVGKPGLKVDGKTANVTLTFVALKVDYLVVEHITPYKI